MNKRIAMLLSLSLALTGCSNDLDPVSIISELRLLAVQADTPFALPGQTVHLKGLAIDPENRPLTWAWGTCIDEQSSLALDCLRATAFESLTIGADLSEHTLTVPQTSSSYVGIAVVVCPGSIVPGNADGIPLSCVDATGTALPFSSFEIGLKRIYTRDSALNQNPQIEGVTFDGEDWPEGEIKQAECKTVKAGACTAYVEYKLAVQAPRAAETSVDRDGKQVTEQAVVQYYASGSDFDDEARVYDSPETKWKAKPEDAGKLITFWFIVRDDRGGVSWITREALVP